MNDKYLMNVYSEESFTELEAFEDYINYYDEFSEPAPAEEVIGSEW